MWHVFNIASIVPFSGLILFSGHQTLLENDFCHNAHHTMYPKFMIDAQAHTDSIDSGFLDIFVLLRHVHKFLSFDDFI